MAADARKAGAAAPADRFMIRSIPVAAAETPGEDLLWLTLDATGTPLPAAYVRAGQFVTLSYQGSPPGYFAMASAPRDPHFQFLIRIERHKPKTASLADLTPGDRVDVSPVAGEGYPLAEQAGRDLLLVAGGTGIAPIRAALFHIMAARENFGAVTLVYGANRLGDMSFASEHERWRAAGVRLIPCLRFPDPDWRGAVGFPTGVVAALPFDAANTTAILCGPQAMTQPLAEMLTDRGFATDRIYENV